MQVLGWITEFRMLCYSALERLRSGQFNSDRLTVFQFGCVSVLCPRTSLHTTVRLPNLTELVVFLESPDIIHDSVGNPCDPVEAVMEIASLANQLRRIELKYCVSARAITEIARITTLERLDLGDADFFGPGESLVCIGDMPNLCELTLPRRVAEWAHPAPGVPIQPPALKTLRTWDNEDLHVLRAFQSPCIDTLHFNVSAADALLTFAAVMSRYPSLTSIHIDKMPATLSSRHMLHGLGSLPHLEVVQLWFDVNVVHSDRSMLTVDDAHYISTVWPRMRVLFLGPVDVCFFQLIIGLPLLVVIAVDAFFWKDAWWSRGPVANATVQNLALYNLPREWDADLTKSNLVAALPRLKLVDQLKSD